MRVRWVVDGEANESLWRDLHAMPLRLADRPGSWVLDLGGGSGSFASPLRERGVREISVDVDLAALRDSRARGVDPVRASALQLPFRTASVDAMAGRAILHHVPEDLDEVMEEVRRVVKPGGLVLFQEPTAGNWIADIARRRLPTEKHDPHERPLPFVTYVDAVARHFELLEARPHFLFSYLMPHVVARLPPDRRHLARRLTGALASSDRHLLRSLSGLRDRAAYVSVLARRP